MMLKIGISSAIHLASCVLRKAHDGFTLIEVMVATCLLSLGAVLISGSLFISMDSFNYCAIYLDAAPWMDEKLWAVQDNLSRLGELNEANTTGQFLSRNKNVKWSLNYNLISPDFYQIDLVLLWKEGQRNVRLLRSTYALFEPQQ